MSRKERSSFGKGATLKIIRKMVAIDEAVHIGRVRFSPIDHVEKLGLYLKSNGEPKKIKQRRDMVGPTF